MPTSYSNYKISDLSEILLLRDANKKLFPAEVPPVEPSELLKTILKMHLRLPLGTEKAKSELIVVPLLNELIQRNNDFFRFFSGYTFDVDAKKSLKGRSDFIISVATNSTVAVDSPIISIIEAKNDNLEDGIAQCIAQMYASRIFNERKKTQVPVLFGAVTTGFDWLFLKIETENVYYIDTEYYYLKNLPELLGVWQIIIDHYKPKL
jgi:hypothetical protein